MITRRTFGTALMGAAALLSATAFSVTADAAGVLKIAREQDSTTFDPIFTILAPDVWVLNQFYSTLVRANADATGIEPDLAESWEVSPDGKTFGANGRRDDWNAGSHGL